jgi:molybdate transport system regulatory protein
MRPSVTISSKDKTKLTSTRTEATKPNHSSAHQSKADSSSLHLYASTALQQGQMSPGQSKQWGLIKAVATTGSITQAAKSVSMSYKAAWDNIEKMNAQSAQPLLTRSTGGKGGGSTQLTPFGITILKRYEDLNHYLDRYLKLLNQYSTNLEVDIDIAHLLNMKTSASNQFSGKITHIKAGKVNDEITVATSPHTNLVASITSESRQNMQLVTGDIVFALIQASSIIVMTNLNKGQLSARNQMAGIIYALKPGAVNVEVVIDCGDGQRLVTMVTEQSVADMKLKKGVSVLAAFKAGHVMLGKLA